MFHRVLRIAGCVVLVVLSVWMMPARAADDATFTVSNVHEDVTAKSALAARDQAVAKGERDAFDTLMTRLAPGTPPTVTPAMMDDLVAGFEVANEKTSPVRYIADFTFHFNPAAVRKLLQNAGTTYAEPANPVVVLPVLKTGTRAVLWDDPNPWRDAWANHPDNQGPLPVVVPVGGLTDVSLIDAPKALAGDPAAIKAMSARYQNDDVVVAAARLAGTPPRLDITAARYSAASPATPQTAIVSVAGKPGESEQDLMARAVTATIGQLAQNWQAANTINSNESGTLTATVPASSLQDWVAVRDRLRSVSAVHGLDLVAIDSSDVKVAIHYVGTQDQLRGVLAQRGLTLGGDDPDWTLTMAGGAANPPPLNGPSGNGTSDISSDLAPNQSSGVQATPASATNPAPTTPAPSTMPPSGAEGDQPNLAPLRKATDQP